MDPKTIVPTERDGGTRPPTIELTTPMVPRSYVPALPQEPTIWDYLRVLQKRRWTVIATLVVIFLTVTIVTLRTTPLYEASGRIVINRENSPVIGQEWNFEDWDPSIKLETEIQVLQSDILALKTARKLGLVPDTTLAGEISRGGTATGKPLDVSDPAARRGISAVKGGLRVDIVPKTRILELKHRDSDPEMAAKIINTLAQTYIDHSFETKLISTQQTTERLARELADLQLKVEAAKEKLVRYQMEKGIVGVDDKENITTTRLADLNSQVTAAEADRIQKEAAFKMAKEGDPELIAQSEMGSLINTLRSQEADLQRQYAQLTVQYGDAHPRVAEVRNQLTQVQNTIKSEIRKMAGRLEGAYLAALQRERMLRGAFERQKQEANQLNQDAITYGLLKQDVQSTQKLYDDLQQRLKEADVTAGLRSTNISIIDQANVPKSPAYPNVPRNIGLGLLVGLAAGIALAFLMEVLDRTIRTPEQVQQIAALPALGVVPLNSRLPGRRFGRRQLLTSMQRQQGNMALITHYRPRSEIAEAYRALRTSILLSTMGAPPKVIVVTSALPEEGKTTTSLNTAIVLAQKGARVLLVDADLRRPSIHASLGLRSNTGLSTILTGTDTFENAVIASSQLTNLHVLPAGPPPPQPAELLGSVRMKDLLRQWRQQFDHIIIDTPPALSVTDAVVLSVDADSVILVIRSGQTPKDALRRSRDLLHQVSARVMGVVVNAVDLQSPDLYYYYYGSKYGGRYYDDRKRK